MLFFRGETGMTRIKKMRIQRGLKATELAQKLNISRSSVCAAEKKGLKNVKAAQRYASALSCRPDELLEM